MIINQAFIMAAGYATRMRPLTDNLPKPLLNIDQKPMLGHIIDHLLTEGVTKIIINGHHAIEPLRNYIKEIQSQHSHCEFILSEEDDLLETGGGTVLALQHLNKDDPFYMINGDAYWVNEKQERTLNSLQNFWNDHDFDIALLLQPIQTMPTKNSIGDYNINNQCAIRSHDKKGDHMFTGIRICHPDIISNYTATKFSFLTIMDESENLNRLGGCVHNGQWYHISTPEDLDDINTMISQKKMA